MNAKLKAIATPLIVGLLWAVWAVTLPFAGIHLALDEQLQPNAPAADNHRSMYVVGAVAGVVMVCVGGAVAAIPALVAAGGVALAWRCCAKLFLGR